MFDRSSRYHDLPELRHRAPDGRVVVYKTRRFLPAPAGAAAGDATEADIQPGDRVQPGDRPDLLCTRAGLPPERYWQLCDANGVMHPAELTDGPGRRVRVP